MSICPPDFDNDGINDNIDLDIDNDGIYNDVESWGDGIFDLSDLSVPQFCFSWSLYSVSGIFTVSTTANAPNNIATTAGGIITQVLLQGVVSQIKLNFYFL